MMIRQSDLNAVARALNMAALSVPDLRALILEARQNDDVFASRVMRVAATQILAVKRANGASNV